MLVHSVIVFVSSWSEYPCVSTYDPEGGTALLYLKIIEIFLKTNKHLIVNCPRNSNMAFKFK